MMELRNSDASDYSPWLLRRSEAASDRQTTYDTVNRAVTSVSRRNERHCDDTSACHVGNPVLTP